MSLILYRLFFSPLAAKLIGPRTGCQFFKKNVDFSVTYPLKAYEEGGFATSCLRVVKISAASPFSQLDDLVKGVPVVCFI